MKIQTYTIKGVKGEDMALPAEFNQKLNMPFLAQAVHIFEERSHVGLRNTKTRAEINRTTKKVYKQKGTGGARHGSRRANLYVGGGVALGPRPVRRILSLSDRMKTQAKFLAYSLKAAEKQMVAVSGLSKIEKTNAVKGLVKTLRKTDHIKSLTFVLSEDAMPAIRSLRNLDLVKSVSYKDASVYDIFTGGMIVMDEGVFAKKAEVKAKTEVVKKTVKKTTKTK
jgi:large subunit ribosomal protein L4